MGPLRGGEDFNPTDWNMHWGPIRGGEELTPTDWNMHWDQRGDWAIMRGGRRHRRVLHEEVLVLFFNKLIRTRFLYWSCSWVERE